jgi:hypothetical protein
MAYSLEKSVHDLVLFHTDVPRQGRSNCDQWQRTKQLTTPAGKSDARCVIFGPQGDHGELMLLYLGAMVMLILAGAGRFSIDRLMDTRYRGSAGVS